MRLIRSALAAAGASLLTGACACRRRRLHRDRLRRPRTNSSAPADSAHRHQRHSRLRSRSSNRTASRPWSPQEKRSVGLQEGSPERPVLGRKRDEELRGHSCHATRRRAQAEAGRPRQYAPPRTPSRKGRRLRLRRPAQPHERDSGLHELRTMDRRRQSQPPTSRDLPAATRLIGCEAHAPSFRPAAERPTRTRTTSWWAEILQRVTGQVAGESASRGTNLQAARALLATAFEERRDEPFATTSCTASTSPRRHRPTSRCTGLAYQMADGAIVSNAHDLAVFFGALLRGKLVPPRTRRSDADDRPRLTW